jgi:predicted metal-dependent peptidase
MDPPEDMTPEEMEKVEQQIRDAVLQGEIVQGQLRGSMGSPNRLLEGFREQRTDWRGPLRRFISEICEGDDQSRFNPPNRRFLAHDIIMPSHFSESADELLIACDTSGSMTGVYPIVFGEIANIARTVMPKRIRLLWWDTQVAGEQVFEPKDYDRIQTAMAPKGGGGTTVSCVAAHVKAKGYKPRVTIMLTDGYVESSYEVVPGNVLWGIVGNRSFQPLRGKMLHIEET